MNDRLEAADAYCCQKLRGLGDEHAGECSKESYELGHDFTSWTKGKDALPHALRRVPALILIHTGFTAENISIVNVVNDKKLTRERYNRLVGMFMHYSEQ